MLLRSVTFFNKSAAPHNLTLNFSAAGSQISSENSELTIISEEIDHRATSLVYGLGYAIGKKLELRENKRENPDDSLPSFKSVPKLNKNKLIELGVEEFLKEYHGLYLNPEIIAKGDDHIIIQILKWSKYRDPKIVDKFIGKYFSYLNSLEENINHIAVRLNPTLISLTSDHWPTSERNSNGETPLHYAIKLKKIDAVKTLLK